MVLVTSPVLPLTEKFASELASPPQVWPSLAVPHIAWLARWKVSVASDVPVPVPPIVVVVVGGAVDVVVELVVVVVVVVVEPDCVATASRSENSSSNQTRSCPSTLRPSCGCPPLGVFVHENAPPAMEIEPRTFCSESSNQIRPRESAAMPDVWAPQLVHEGV